MDDFNRNKGITMIALVITIVILSILVGVTVYGGTSLIKRVKIEEIETNLISIRSKAKVIAEEVNAKVWNEKDEEKNSKRAEKYKTDYGMQEPTSTPKGVSESPVAQKEYVCYEITQQTLDKMGLSKIFNQEMYDDGERYYVLYDSSDYTNLDIIYSLGIEYNDTYYYSLSKLQEVMNAEE